MPPNSIFIRIGQQPFIPQILFDHRYHISLAASLLDMRRFFLQRLQKSNKLFHIDTERFPIEGPEDDNPFRVDDEGRRICDPPSAVGMENPVLSDGGTFRITKKIERQLILFWQQTRLRGGVDRNRINGGIQFLEDL